MLTILVLPRQVEDRIDYGYGYGTPTWRQSPTLAHVAALPSEAPVVSNAADAIHVLLQRPATLPPMSRFPTAGRPNTRRYEQLADLRGQRITFVWFDAIDRDYLVTLDEVKRYLDVEEVARFDDGVVLRERVPDIR